MPFNNEIIKWFELLIKQLEFYVDVKTGKNKLVYSYKLKSIKKALNVIKKINYETKGSLKLRSMTQIISFSRFMLIFEQDF